LREKAEVKEECDSQLANVCMILPVRKTVKQLCLAWVDFSKSAKMNGSKKYDF
jgi:hypothetical protein